MSKIVKKKHFHNRNEQATIFDENINFSVSFFDWFDSKMTLKFFYQSWNSQKF